MATKNNRTARIIFRLVASVGIGLGMAAIWWEYSEVLIQKGLTLLGLGG